jgi:arylsulfatase A-like enzyme
VNPPGSRAAPRERPNLLLISMDTLRADVAYSGLPHLDRLRARGTSFTSAIAAAPLTPVSHASVFTGLYPPRHGVRHLLRERLDCDAPTLAELASRAGYETGAVVSCPGMNAWYRFDRGFRHYDDEIPRLVDGRNPVDVVDVKLRGTALKRADVVAERSLEWLAARRERPFVFFMHLFDTHWPYEPPSWFAPAGANPYEGEAYFADHHLGIVIDQLERWRVLDNTLVVLFSDHGEDLAGWYADDHAGIDLGHPEEEGHGCLLFDCTQRVPLVVVDPGRRERPATVGAQVRLVDILPTVAGRLGLELDGALDGASLEPLLAGRDDASRPAYFETYYREEQAAMPSGVPGLGPLHGVRLDNRHKIISDVRTGAIALYDLALDPNERSPQTLGARGR